MKTPSAQIRDLGLVRRIRDEDDEDDVVQKPLEWSIIRRLFGYAAPVQKKLTTLSMLTVIRAAQRQPAHGGALARFPASAGTSGARRDRMERRE